MNPPSLPVRLAKEPMIDAVFEVRFQTSLPLSSVLPGVLFSRLEGVEAVENLPLAQLPFDLRSADPQLKFMPTTRLKWKGFLVLVGDHMASVACRMPYPGWADFRLAIVEVFTHLRGLPFIKEVDRWALKYVDMFEHTTTPPLEKLNLEIHIGGTKLGDQSVSMRAEIDADGFEHAVQVATVATVQLLDGPQRTGTVLDVDSAKNESAPLASFLDELPSLADAMHASNKRIFFACVSDRGLKELEPIYE